MGIKGSSTRTLILDQAEVPKENLLGEIGKGHVIAFNILNIGRYKLAVGTIGASKRVIELSAAYANQRRQFKTPISSFTLTQEKLATMSARLYAMESSVYRTVGLFEDNMSRLTEEEQKDGREVAKSIAEYAIECSLNKMCGSETLDYIADEGVQIHGGYGFMQEYEVERAYRDSRINRIFEGTNEINRLIVTSTFLKKAVKGQAPLFEKAKALQEELMMLMPEEPGSEPLEQEKYIVRQAKKIALLTAGLAAQKYGKEIEGEQEIMVNIADIVSALYALESAVLRTEKAIAADGAEKAAQKLLYTEIFAQEALQNIEAHAKESLIAMEEGDSLRMMLSVFAQTDAPDAEKTSFRKREAALFVFREENIQSDHMLKALLHQGRFFMKQRYRFLQVIVLK